MKQFLFFCLLIVNISVYSQVDKDSLLKKEYSFLSQKVRDNIENEEVAIQYAKIYLKKAKIENNQLGLATGYRLHARVYTKEDLQLTYLDSAVNISLNMNNKYYPALLLLKRGGIYYEQKKFKAALKDYLLANQYAKKNNEELYFTIKYNLGMIKRQIGNYNEAEEIFNECLSYESKYKDFNNGKVYLAVLFQLSNLYYETKQFSKATAINKDGIKESLKFNDSLNYHYFVVNEGINLSLQKKYKRAIDSIKKAIPHIKEKADLAVAYHYLGTSLYENESKDESIKYFMKVDTIFLETKDLLPSLRSTYEKLINYHKFNDNKEKQLVYTNRLLSLDSVLNDDYKFLVKNLYKEYDFPELMSEKEQLIQSLKEDSKTADLFIAFLAIFLSIAVIALVYYYQQKRRYKSRFESLMHNNDRSLTSMTADVVKNEEAGNGLKDIDKKTIEQVMLSLELFEKEKHFLENKITLNKVAKIIDTNSKYLSRILNQKFKKNFSTYINDLRVDYLIERLKNEENFRKYTIEAIAEEGGFTNGLSFSRAFSKRTGIKPSYFIKRLNE